MQIKELGPLAVAMLPAVMMAVASALAGFDRLSTATLWRAFTSLSVLAFVAACTELGMSWGEAPAQVMIGVISPLSGVMTLLVQILGVVIGSFSARYLQGEAGQRRYIGALASVLAGVHLLLMADHWLVLIAAWTGVGLALKHLLCFYPDRPFALLAAHKKQIADRVADVLLVTAALLAWQEVGSGSVSALFAHIGQHGMSATLQASAVAVVLAVVLRTALLPVHGWLIQVMEAPTPVSALLHAGVVNLGGFVLIRFAPLLENATAARALLLVFGLGTAVLGGMVMLTRISIKVRLAWSTVAQMGFMLTECALGLYTLAALHLIGHSLYKAHAFLSASSVVRHTRQQALHDHAKPAAYSTLLAPVSTITAVHLTLVILGPSAWPWWWTGVFGLAWAPLLWLPVRSDELMLTVKQTTFGFLQVMGLTTAARIMHAAPLGIQDMPYDGLGWVALLGMTVLYTGLATLQLRPQLLGRWRRWSYAGFYVDEAYTRLALQCWPAHWASRPPGKVVCQTADALPADFPL